MLKNLMLVSLLNIGKLLLQSSFAIVIALFTSPERFGLIGFSLPLVTFLILMGTAGIAPAIIRQPQLSGGDLGASLTLVAIVSVSLSSGIAAASPFLEHAARLPGLAPVLSVLGIVIIPANVAETLRAALERQLRYQPLVKIELIALIFAVICAICHALAGGGVWALVVYHLVLQTARVAGMAAFQRGEIRLNLDWRTIRPMMFFGSLTLAANLFNFAARNTDNLLIGGTFGSRAVGLYGVAYQLMILPLIAVAWPASNLLLATLKRLSPDDGQQFARTVGEMLTFTAALAFPIAAWLSTALLWPAQHALPARWLDVAPLVTILAPAGALQSLAAFTGAVLLARDKPRLNLSISIANCVLLIAGFVTGLQYGFRAFVMIYVILSSIISIAQLAILSHVARIAARSLIAGLAPASIGAMLIGFGFSMIGSRGASWPSWCVMNILAAAILAALYTQFYPHLLGGMLGRLRAGRRQPMVG